MNKIIRVSQRTFSSFARSPKMFEKSYVFVKREPIYRVSATHHASVFYFYFSLHFLIDMYFPNYSVPPRQYLTFHVGSSFPFNTGDGLYQQMILIINPNLTNLFKYI